MAGQREDGGGDQRVVEDDVGLGQPRVRPRRQQLGIAGPGARPARRARRVPADSGVGRRVRLRRVGAGADAGSLGANSAVFDRRLDLAFVVGAADVDGVERAEQLGAPRLHRDAGRLPADALGVGDAQPGVQVGREQAIQPLAQQAGQRRRAARRRDRQGHALALDDRAEVDRGVRRIVDGVDEQVARRRGGGDGAVHVGRRGRDHVPDAVEVGDLERPAVDGDRQRLDVGVDDRARRR